METVQTEGNRQVKRMVVMYKLDAIIAVGYRVNSLRAPSVRHPWLRAGQEAYGARDFSHSGLFDCPWIPCSLISFEILPI